MNDEEIEPVAADLAALFGDERAKSAVPEGAKARVLTRVERSLAVPGGGGPGGGPGPRPSGRGVGRVARVLAVFVVGGVAGAALHAALSAPRVVYVDRPSSVVEAPRATRVAAEVREEASGAPSTVETPPRGSSGPPVANDTLAAERALLDVAHTALGRGDGTHALEAVERHERTFPRGQLSEEREAIAVQALAKLGRKDEAGARGARFRKRYPDSVLRPVVDAALGEARD